MNIIANPSQKLFFNNFISLIVFIAHLQTIYITENVFIF